MPGKLPAAATAGTSGGPPVRVLSPGPRALVAFGVLWLLVAGLLFVVAAVYRRPFLPTLQGLGYLALVFAAILGSIYLQKIEVGGEHIAMRYPFGFRRRVAFRDIAVSRRRTLAEPRHPVHLDVYVSDPKRPGRPVLKLRLRLKAYRLADVAWLLSLPHLKVAD